ncbi:Na+-transporting ATP synthase [Staphylococcus aureus]|uniref:Na+-transporting ATP synthase n=1 Tax=Staphylococcus aureus TaxID=1280 RepID=A0A8G2M757_STAAU|nr:Na+-transporting ATP synthase [Staphylococcus aureus]
MNLTTEYHGITKIIIIFVMLCGKVGLLTLLRTFIPPKSPKITATLKDKFIYKITIHSLTRNELVF